MNRETKIKILSSTFFVLIFLVTAYLVYYSNMLKSEELITSIKITGNELLSANDYLTYAHLYNPGDNVNKFKGLNSAIIRDRFQKHPYVKKADIKFEGEGNVSVFLQEKKLYGMVITNTEAFLIAENFEVLPNFPNAKVLDLPVLSNIRGSDLLKPLSKIKSGDMLQAFKIIDAAQLANEKILENLDEINLRNGGDVLLTFSGFSAPVLFGRGNEAAKIICLQSLSKNFSGKANFTDEASYIDLRFNNNIYLGNTRETEL
jgi:cell division septal protein FtsQ